MKKLAVIIKTTPKRKSILWLLNSAEISLKDCDYRLYIADEQPIDDWKIELYNKLQENGHYIHIWEEPVSVTVARNYLINQLQNEKYVLRVDDDFELGGEFHLNNMIELLESKLNIDFCCSIERQIGKGKNVGSGELRIASGFIYLEKKKWPLIKLKKDNEWNFTIHNGINYAKADFMRNLILLKRKCFEYVRWNEDLNFEGEHSDFYLSLKKFGLQGAFTPDSIHYHRDDLKHIYIDKDDDLKRRRSSSENQIVCKSFTEKWGGYPEMNYVGVYGIYKKFRKSVKKALTNVIDL